MQFPLDFLDVSLLLAVISIILLVTAELISPYHGHTNLLVDKKKLREAALIMGISFLITVAIRIISILTA